MRVEWLTSGESKSKGWNGEGYMMRVQNIEEQCLSQNFRFAGRNP